jgi:predicted ATPase
MTDERTIQQLEIQNYGCIRKATVALSPLQALIGPNDSGKSTVLRALRTIAQFAAGYFENANDPSPIPFAHAHGRYPHAGPLRRWPGVRDCERRRGA